MAGQFGIEHGSNPPPLPNETERDYWVRVSKPENHDGPEPAYRPKEGATPSEYASHFWLGLEPQEEVTEIVLFVSEP